MARVKEQLDELGPAPKDGEPPESEEIAEKREELTREFSLLDGELKAGRLIVVRAAQLVSPTGLVVVRLYVFVNCSPCWLQNSGAGPTTDNQKGPRGQQPARPIGLFHSYQAK